jgi:hypothetical protein
VPEKSHRPHAWFFLSLLLATTACTTLNLSPAERHVFGGATETFEVVVRRNGRRTGGEPIQATVTAIASHPADCAAISGQVNPTNPEGVSGVGVKGKPDTDRDCVAILKVSAPNLPARADATVIVHPRRVTEEFSGDPRRGTVTVWPMFTVEAVWRWLLTTNNDALVRRLVVRTPEDISVCNVYETERAPRGLRTVITRPDTKSFEVTPAPPATAQDGWERLEVELSCAETPYPSKLGTTFLITPVAGQAIELRTLPGPERP